MRSIETRYLKPGNILFNTGEEVITTPLALCNSRFGSNTPKNKLEFIVKTKNGELVTKVWNKNYLTLIK